MTQKVKLIYKIGNKIVQSWDFSNRALAYYSRRIKTESGRFTLGKFEIINQ